MATISYIADFLQTLTDRGRELISFGRGGEVLARGGVADIVKLCEELLSQRGEASGVALAGVVLNSYAGLSTSDRHAFLGRIASEFGADRAAVDDAVEAYRATPTPTALGALHEASEARSQELIRRLNLAPDGTRSLVRMREDLMARHAKLLATEPRDNVLIEAVDRLDHDFQHLFSSWFNRGFLLLRRIDWTTPAHILEKIIRYEAVHEISDWDDLRRRIEPADRRCFCFFHPALPDEPLIFVEVALTRSPASGIAPILATSRTTVTAGDAKTANFYSISNCQQGLTGVSFGNFLIKQVVDDLRRDLPSLKTFVTLSPVPGFARWLDQQRRADEPAGLSRQDVEILGALEKPDWNEDAETVELLRKPMISAATYYFLHAKSSNGRPLDPVARFHLGNGARLNRLNYLGDTSRKGLDQSYGLMVNYLYDLDAIEKNHENYVNQGIVTVSADISRDSNAKRAPREAATTRS